MLNKQNRDLALEHIQKVGASVAGNPVGNFFMMSIKGFTGAQIGAALAAKKVHVAGANRWPEWPNQIRRRMSKVETQRPNW